MKESLIGEITIRPLEVERDGERVAEIVGCVWSGGDDALMEKQFGVIGGKPWGEWLSGSVLSYLTADGARSFVAEKGDEVVGFCSYVIDKGRSRGTVGYNAVAPGQQGQGLGSAMMSFVLERIKAEGMEYSGVIVADNEEHAPARRVYEKHGFRRLTGYHYLVQKL